MQRDLTFDGHPGRLVVLLFKDVTNAKEIKASLVSRSLDIEAAFINASMVPDIFLVHLSAFKALTDKTKNQLTTHTLHTDVVFNLAGSKHINQTLASFGISDTTTSLLVGKFDATEEDVAKITALVKGEQVPVEELPSMCDRDAVQKAFKCTDEELAVGSLLDAALCKCAVKDC